MARRAKIIEGNTLMIRIGYAPRAGSPYFPPLDILTEYVRFSNAHGGRMMWVDSRPACSPDKTKTLTNIIFFSSKVEFAVLGEIADAGTGSVPPLGAYQVPEPWNRFKERYWYKLDNLRVLSNLCFEDYESFAIAQTKTPDVTGYKIEDVVPLTQELAYKRRTGVFYIRPLTKKKEDSAVVEE
ncbi:hypothetical protein [Bifidobacterium sp. SO1]|uniref:hypothetical protein n=1 Tax=Bifidobacterium sp. SO1 TaxID=2809029 RepID=UPI001BDC3D36|nr:hypothetical protein [Bifidobacterium sp. SO1]MBT1162771.1 hypothetical protein [Bifidobacterium sp. SO1]